LRGSRLLIPALTMILMISAIIPLTQAQVLTAKRVVEVTQYGLVYVYDEVPRTGDLTRISFPKEALANLVDYRSSEDPNPELKVDKDVFSIIVHSRSGDFVHLVTIFKNVVKWNEMNNLFMLRMSLNPILDEKVDEFSIIVKLPSDAKPSQINPNYIVEKEKGVLSGNVSKIDLTKRPPQTLSIDFTSDRLNLLDVTDIDAEYRLPDRFIKLRLRFRNIGGKDLSRISFKLPANCSDVRAEDDLGEVMSIYDSKIGSLDVVLRQQVKVGEYGSVNICFKLPVNNPYVESLDNRFKISPILPINVTVRRYVVKLLLKSMEFVSSDPEPAELVRVYPENIRLTYILDHVNPFNIENSTTILDCRPFFSMFGLMPYIWIGAVAAVVLAAVTCIYLRKPKPILSKVDLSMRRLIEEADSLTASYQDLTSLIASGRIVEKGYVRPRILDFRASIKRHGDKILAIASDLMKSSPELKDSMTSIRNSVKRLEQSVEELWVMIHRYLSGRIGRSAFEKRVNRHYKILKKVYGEFAEAIEELRERVK